MSVRFGGDWGSLIPQMEEVAGKNGVLEVVLTPEEFNRLGQGGLAELKARVSPALACRFVLLEDYPVENGDAPILLVAHLGRCPH